MLTGNLTWQETLSFMCLMVNLSILVTDNLNRSMNILISAPQVQKIHKAIRMDSDD